MTAKELEFVEKELVVTQSNFGCVKIDFIVVDQMIHTESLLLLWVVCRFSLELVAIEVEVHVSKCGTDQLELVDTFCYLRDMFSCYGDAVEAVSARIGNA